MERVDRRPRRGQPSPFKVKTFRDLRRAYRRSTGILTFGRLEDYAAWLGLRTRIDQLYGEKCSADTLSRLQIYVARQMNIRRSELSLKTVPEFHTICILAFHRPKSKRPGRPRKYDARRDARIARLWTSSGHRTYAEGAAELDVDVSVLKATVDRDRHRPK